MKPFIQPLHYLATTLLLVVNLSLAPLALARDFDVKVTETDDDSVTVIGGEENPINPIEIKTVEGYICSVRMGGIAPDMTPDAGQEAYYVTATIYSEPECGGLKEGKIFICSKTNKSNCPLNDDPTAPHYLVSNSNIPIYFQILQKAMETSMYVAGYRSNYAELTGASVPPNHAHWANRARMWKSEPSNTNQ